MPSHNYERVPLHDDGISLDGLDSSYYTGIPNTAPPSFHSSIASPPYLPHKHDESAATIMPPRSRSEPQNSFSIPSINIPSISVPPTSLWGPSSSTQSVDLEAAREDTIARLMDRVEELERRLDSQGKEEEGQGQVRGASVKWTTKQKWEAVGITLAMVLCSAFIMAIPLISVMAKYRAAGQHKD